MTRGREAGLELVRMLATLVWVVGVSAAAVAGLGALPGWLAGEERGVHHVATIEVAERRLGARVILPAVYPERLAWPPAQIRIAGGRRGSVELTLVDHAGAPALQLLQSTAEGEPIAPALLADRSVKGSQRTSVDSRPATLSSVHVGGEAWQELSWDLRGRSVILRGRGDLDELYRMAGSVHREGGR
jgi:hypothetical protein